MTISEKMIDYLIWEAQGGSEEARCWLEDLGVWEPSPALPKSYHSRPCQCGSGQAWVSCSANSSYCG